MFGNLFQGFWLFVLFAGWLLVAALVSACKTDQGVRKGPFEQSCESQGGIIARVSSNEYECKLPDGTIIKSQDKK